MIFSDEFCPPKAEAAGSNPLKRIVIPQNVASIEAGGTK